MAKHAGTLVPVDHIAQSIRVLRGHKVILDADLATLYGVTTARLNQQVRRNRKRFPADFLFELTPEEFANLKLHFATSSWGGRRKLPIAFTEHGAITAATVLNSPRAVEMTVYVVRAFVKLRELLASNKDLSRKLAALERSLITLDLKTQRQFKEVYDAIRSSAHSWPHPLPSAAASALPSISMRSRKRARIGFVNDGAAFLFFSGHALAAIKARRAGDHICSTARSTPWHKK